jgi:4-hydroxybenzoate polyprenyltransferase
MPAANGTQSVPGLLLRSMRPLQWTKNLLLFAGIIFSHNLSDPSLLLRTVLGFALFSGLAGAVYIINDLVDIEADRHHPTKKHRPLAAGLLATGTALRFALVLAIAMSALAFWLSVDFGTVAVAYFVMSILYSQVFKQIAILDIIFLALGFVLRAIAGVLVIRTPGGPAVAMTPWFVVCVLFLALFIAVCKRRHELLSLDNATDHRAALKGYSQPMLDQMMSVAASATVIAYALYLVAGMHDGASGGSLKMMSTLPFVLYGIFRYMFLVYNQDEGGEPDRLLLRDKPLLVNAILWLAIMIFLHKD